MLEIEIQTKRSQVRSVDRPNGNPIQSVGTRNAEQYMISIIDSHPLRNIMSTTITNADMPPKIRKIPANIVSDSGTV
jgi:hypothetical protein